MISITPYKLGGHEEEWKYTVVGFPTADTPHAFDSKRQAVVVSELEPAWRNFRQQFERRHSCHRAVLAWAFVAIFLGMTLGLNKLFMGTDPDTGKDATGGLTLVALGLAMIVWIGGTFLGSYILLDVGFRNNVYQREFEVNLLEYGYEVRYSSAWVAGCCLPSIHGVLTMTKSKQTKQVV